MFDLASLDDEVSLEETEHDLQGIVDRTELGLRKRADTPAEAGSIEGPDLLGEDPRTPAADLDLGAEDGRKRARRGRRDDDC